MKVIKKYAFKIQEYVLSVLHFGFKLYKFLIILPNVTGSHRLVLRYVAAYTLHYRHDFRICESRLNFSFPGSYGLQRVELIVHNIMSRLSKRNRLGSAFVRYIAKCHIVVCSTASNACHLARRQLSQSRCWVPRRGPWSHHHFASQMCHSGHTGYGPL